MCNCLYGDKRGVIMLRGLILCLIVSCGYCQGIETYPPLSDLILDYEDVKAIAYGAPLVGISTRDGRIVQWPTETRALPTREEIDAWKVARDTALTDAARIAALKELGESRRRLTELQDLKSIDPTAVATADLATIEAEVDAALVLYKATYPTTPTAP